MASATCNCYSIRWEAVGDSLEKNGATEADDNYLRIKILRQIFILLTKIRCYKYSKMRKSLLIAFA